MFDQVWNSREKFVLRILFIGWCVSLVVFWIWWLDLDHVGTVAGYILTSMVLAWSMLLPGYCYFFLFRMKKPSKKNRVNKHLKAAVVVTKAPSEPLSVIQKTLKGALSMKGTFDVWVADEDPDGESLIWYKENGINVSCRKNIKKYHNKSWPRRTKCKEGNLAYFYDKYAYKKYDIVMQLDADHVPEKSYFKRVLTSFYDDSVGYVASPSICDNNASTSWATRARINSESMFHGPIQTGTNSGWTPICIGSHYAVRTKALKEIGGLGPELAEDYSTTLLMNAHGWKGVWSYDGEAHGDGPNTFADLITQDYQWSRSLVTLLISFYFKYWKSLAWRQKVQFTFTQLWYPVGATLWFVSILLPMIALLTGIVPVTTKFGMFVFFAAGQFIFATSTYLYVKHKRHLRPQDVKFFSWENALFELARWPWILVACGDALYSKIFKKEHTFKVTPKGTSDVSGLPFKIYIPYFAIVFLAIVALFFGKNKPGLFGYYWFTISILTSYVVLIVSTVFLHARELNVNLKIGLMLHKKQLAFVSIIILLFVHLVYSENVFDVSTYPFLVLKAYKRIRGLV